MATYTAVLEQAEDNSWSAYTLAPSLVIGTGSTREDALADLRSAMTVWLQHMRETEQPVSVSPMELVTFEVAA